VALVPPGARRVLRLARIAYAAVLVAVLVWLLVTRRDDLAALVDDARPLVLAGCLAATFGQLALTSALWSSGLRALAAPVGWRTSLAATAVSLPARYLPGSVWYAVSRGAVLQRQGVPARALVAVATLETVLAPVVGIPLGALLLVASGAGGRLDGVLTVPVAVGALALLALASPPVVNRALRVRAGDDAPHVSWPVLGRLVGWLVLFWLWSGAVFALYLSAFPDAADAGAVTVVGAYLVAWGAGWLALFAPQGIGVFEVVLAGLLVGGSAELAVVLAGYRLVVLARDLTAAAAAGALGRRRPAAPVS
jgi:uncharacterized membrane protein YbhN (UPF0104 family)